MQKSKMGISVALLGAALYLTAMFGGTMSVLLLAGYILLAEDNQWLRLTAVKAATIFFFFTFAGAMVDYVPNAISLISSVATLFKGGFSVPVLTNIVAVVHNVLDFIEKVFLTILAVKALNQGTIAVPFVDNLVVKYL